MVINCHFFPLLVGVIHQELELYKPELVSKPAVLILNKIDTEGAERLCDVTVDKVKHMQGWSKRFCRYVCKGESVWEIWTLDLRGGGVRDTPPAFSTPLSPSVSVTSLFPPTSFRIISHK